MVINSYYSCDACGCKLRFRYQAGYLKSTVSVYCPKCNSHIYGKIETKDHIDEDMVGVSRENKDEWEYIIELASEFLVTKPKAKGDKEEYDLTPFIRNMTFLGLDNKGYEEHEERLNRLISLSENRAKLIWEFESIFGFLRDGKTDLLVTFLKKLDNPFVTTLKELEDFDSIHSKLDALVVAKHYVNCILQQTMVADVPEKVHGIMCDVFPRFSRQHPDALRDFCHFLRENEYFEVFYKKIPEFILEYFKCLNQLVPIYNVYTKFDTIDLSTYGISTVSVDDLTALYQKGYEIMCDSMDFFIGLYNIETKGGFDGFEKGIFDFKEKMAAFSSKYKKYEFICEKKFHMLEGISGKLDNTIRNAIGHNSVDRCGCKQEILFHDKNKKGIGKTETYSFLEFGKITIDLYNSLLLVWEYYYQAAKALLIMEGESLNLHVKALGNCKK